MEKRKLKLSEITLNGGQVPGLPKNPRFIKDAAFEKLKKSLTDDPEFTEHQSLLVFPYGGKYVTVGGNMRLRAARELGWKEILCDVLEEDTPEEKLRAYAIKDNLAYGDDDWDALANEWDAEELGEWGVELPAMEDEATAQSSVEEDDFDEGEDEVAARVQSGDIWQLGEHRLYCGDSTKAESYEALIGNDTIDCCFTDPPYNMSDHMTGFLEDDTRKGLQKITDFDPSFFADMIKLVNTNQYYIFTSKDLIPKYFDIFKEWGFNILIWGKINPTPMTMHTFLPDVEYLLYFYRKGRVWNNGLDIQLYKKFYASEKLEGRKEAGGNVHPTIKPIKIIGDKLQICSNKDGLVLDVFGGSGSTLIACEQLGRRCRMMELDPHYCDVILARWEKLTGKQANKIANCNS